MKHTRAIGLLLVANAISGISQGISMLAIPWYFSHIIQKGELFGVVYFTVTSISLMWGLYAGALIDRYNRKRIFMAINAVGLLVLTGVGAYGFANGYLPWQAVALVFGTTAFIYNIHFPNLYAYVQEISPASDYARVTSLLEIQSQVSFTIAGALAAILLKGVEGHMNLFGFEIAIPFSIKPWKIYEVFALDAATYVVALVIIGLIRAMPQQPRQIDTSVLSERLKSGIRFLLKHKLVLLFGNVSLLVFLTIIITSTYVLPVYVEKFLRRDADVYAFADMAFSMGALMAGFVTRHIFSDKKAVRAIALLSLLAAIMYAVLTFNKILLVFFIVQFIIGACNAAVRIQRITYLFHHIPNYIIGRTNSIFFMLNVFSRLCLIGLFTLPVFHTEKGIASTMMIMAGICLFAAVILAVKYKKLLQQPVTNKD